MKALGVVHFKGNWTDKKKTPSTLPSSCLSRYRTLPPPIPTVINNGQSSLYTVPQEEEGGLWECVLPLCVQRWACNLRGFAAWLIHFWCFPPTYLDDNWGEITWHGIEPIEELHCTENTPDLQYYWVVLCCGDWLLSRARSAQCLQCTVVLITLKNGELWVIKDFFVCRSLLLWCLQYNAVGAGKKDETGWGCKNLNDWFLLSMTSADSESSQSESSTSISFFRRAIINRLFNGVKIIVLY